MYGLRRNSSGLWCYPSALQVACGMGSTDIVDLLIREQANVNYQEEGVSVQCNM